MVEYKNGKSGIGIMEDDVARKMVVNGRVLENGDMVECQNGKKWYRIPLRKMM